MWRGHWRHGDRAEAVNKYVFRFGILLAIGSRAPSGACNGVSLTPNLNSWVRAIGLLFASVTAFIAIYALLRYLERRSTWIFVWYRLMFGAAIVVAVAAGKLHN